MCAGKLIKIRWGFNLKKNFFIAVLALAEISTARALTWPGEEISPLMLAQVENVKRPGDMRTDEQYQADCAAGISLSSCGTMVNPRDCDPGKHWTKLGLGYFHCVVDDMDCGSGATLVHDFKGNASCEAIVCPPRYQLVDGVCIKGRAPSPTPEPLSIPAYDKQPYNYKYNLYVAGIPQGGWIELNYSTIDGSWTMDAPGVDYPSRYTWYQKGPLSGKWTTTPSSSYTYLVTDLYGNNLSGPSTTSGPTLLDPNSVTLVWKCYGGFVNKPGGINYYQPVIIKVWPTASPNKAVSARFNCEASGAAMSPFTIDSRG